MLIYVNQNIMIIAYKMMYKQLVKINEYTLRALNLSLLQ